MLLLRALSLVCCWVCESAIEFDLEPMMLLLFLPDFTVLFDGRAWANRPFFASDDFKPVFSLVYPCAKHTVWSKP